VDNNEQKTLELQAKLYQAIKDYYPSLDALAKKLQDDYNGDKPFVQQEEDRLGLCFILDYYDDINGDIAQIPTQSPRMTDERKTQLLGSFVGWFLDHQTSDEGLLRDLHVEVGMTKEELREYGIQLDKQFEQAEKEHRKEVDEATDMITAEDIVEQAVYAANAPECCAEDHAENMLSMLGANIVDEEVYHDEDECPKLDMGGMQ